MDNKNTPATVSVAQRLDVLRGTVKKCLDLSTNLQGFVTASGLISDIPAETELTNEEVAALRAINCLASLQNELNGLLSYYDSHKSIIEGIVAGSGAQPAQPAQEPQAAPAPVSDKAAQLARAATRPVVRPRAPISHPANAAAAAATNAERLVALTAHAAQQASEAEAAREAARLRTLEQAARAQQQQEEAALPEVADVGEPVASLPAPVSPSAKEVPSKQVDKKLRVATAYERLVTPEISPLTKMFAAAPWFHHGVGTVTVGSTEFGGWHEDHDPMDKPFERQARLPSGFYGKVDMGEGVIAPKYVVIRNQTTILIWNFALGLGCHSIFIFHSVLNPKDTDKVFRVAESCSTSTLRRVLEEFEQVWGYSSGAMVVE